MRQAVEVGDPSDYRREVDHVRAALRRGTRVRALAQVARVDRAALAHPLRRRALVAHAHLISGIREQPPNDCGADRSGAARDEHAAHPLATSAVISVL